MLPWKTFLLTFVVFSVGVHLFAQSNEKKRPNLLWITFEDCDPILGSYGDSLAQTPHLDVLAKRGLRFTQAWANSPVCAPSRTTLITGQYASSLGADHMRSLAPLEDSVRLLPEWLQSAGYFCSNSHKEDYNLVLGRKVWNESHKTAHWRNRSKDQPFFAVFNLAMTHEAGLWSDVDISQVDLAKIPLPPYYPDLPEIRQALARQYANLKRVDQGVKKILDQLDQDGLSENTIVFVLSDHGSGMPRHKRWLYAQGLKVPMLAYFPPAFSHLAKDLSDAAAAGETHRLVSFADMAPTMLSLAGVEIPGTMEGKAFAGAQATLERETHFAFRGRMDEVTDFSRAATDGRYLYLRNYHYEIPQGYTSSYQWNNLAVGAWKRAFDQHELNEAQAAFWKPKVYEEFYDLQADPFAIHNLVPITAHPKLSKLRGELDRHMIETRDQGLIPESLRHYLSKGKPLQKFFGEENNFNPVETLKLAGAASSVQFTEKLPFQTALKSEDPILQYWGALGLIRRSTFEQDEAVLLNLLEHENATVQQLAAAKLVKSKHATSRTEAIEILMRQAENSDADYYVAFEALGVLRTVAPEEIPWLRVEALQQQSFSVAPRVAAFYPRQLGQLLKLKPGL